MKNLNKSFSNYFNQSCSYLPFLTKNKKNSTMNIFDNSYYENNNNKSES